MGASDEEESTSYYNSGGGGRLSRRNSKGDNLSHHGEDPDADNDNDGGCSAAANNDDDDSAMSSLLSSLAEPPSKHKRRQMKAIRSSSSRNNDYKCKNSDADTSTDDDVTPRSKSKSMRARHVVSSRRTKDPQHEYYDEESTVASMYSIPEERPSNSQSRSRGHSPNKKGSSRSSNNNNGNSKSTICSGSCSPFNLCTGVNVKTLIYCILGTTALLKLTNGPESFDVSNSVRGMIRGSSVSNPYEVEEHEEKIGDNSGDSDKEALIEEGRQMLRRRDEEVDGSGSKNEEEMEGEGEGEESMEEKKASAEEGEDDDDDDDEEEEAESKEKQETNNEVEEEAAGENSLLNSDIGGDNNDQDEEGTPGKNMGIMNGGNSLLNSDIEGNTMSGGLATEGEQVQQQQQPNSLMQSDIPAAAGTDYNQQVVTQFQDTRSENQIQEDAITSSLAQEGGFSSHLQLPGQQQQQQQGSLIQQGGLDQQQQLQSMQGGGDVQQQMQGMQTGSDVQQLQQTGTYQNQVDGAQLLQSQQQQQIQSSGNVLGQDQQQLQQPVLVDSSGQLMQNQLQGDQAGVLSSSTVNNPLLQQQPSNQLDAFAAAQMQQSQQQQQLQGDIAIPGQETGLSAGLPSLEQNEGGYFTSSQSLGQSGILQQNEGGDYMITQLQGDIALPGQESTGLSGLPLPQQNEGSQSLGQSDLLQQNEGGDDMITGQSAGQFDSLQGGGTGQLGLSQDNNQIQASEGSSLLQQPASDQLGGALQQEQVESDIGEASAAEVGDASSLSQLQAPSLSDSTAGVDIAAAQQSLDEHSAAGLDVESAQAKLLQLQDLQSQLATAQGALAQGQQESQQDQHDGLGAIVNTEQQAVEQQAAGQEGTAEQAAPSLAAGLSAMDELAIGMAPAASSEQQSSSSVAQAEPSQVSLEAAPAEQAAAAPASEGGTNEDIDKWLNAFENTNFEPESDQQQQPEAAAQPAGATSTLSEPSPSVEQVVAEAMAAGRVVESKPAVTDFDPFSPGIGLPK